MRRRPRHAAWTAAGVSIAVCSLVSVCSVAAQTPAASERAPVAGNAAASEPGAIGRESDNVEDRRSEAAERGETFMCGSKRTCREMESCAEAIFHYERCGLKRLAGSKGGIPCVGSVCRQGAKGWEARLRLESSRDTPWTQQGLAPLPRGAQAFAPARASGANEDGFECVKKYCKDMSSCKEARWHLTVCGDNSLDRDGDGVPCESICR